MLDWITALPRMVQFACGAVLFGVPLFILYAQAAANAWEPRLIWPALSGMLVAAIFAVTLQTAYLMDTGIWNLRFDDIAWYLRDTHIGRFAIFRLVGVVVYGLLFHFLWPGMGRRAVQAGLGATILGSFAWTGHGLEGTFYHTISDVIHLLAAGVWIGALASLGVVVTEAQRNPNRALAAAEGLDAFSKIGIAVVAVLVASGIGNSLSVFGLSNIWELYRSEYGRTLLLKIALFVGMLGLAAANRYRLVPGLRHTLAQGDTSASLRSLHFSVALETSIALAVLLLAARLGSIQPPS